MSDNAPRETISNGVPESGRSSERKGLATIATEISRQPDSKVNKLLKGAIRRAGVYGLSTAGMFGAVSLLLPAFAGMNPAGLAIAGSAASIGVLAAVGRRTAENRRIKSESNQ